MFYLVFPVEVYASCNYFSVSLYNFILRQTQTQVLLPGRFTVKEMSTKIMTVSTATTSMIIIMTSKGLTQHDLNLNMTKNNTHLNSQGI